jgi:nitrogen fixation/metabolism regulation signal transduction histidine kinase
MGFSHRFVTGLAWRVALLLVAAFLFVASLRIEGLAAARLVAALLCAAAVAALWRFVQRTNLELARFVDAIRFGDLSQGFASRHVGSGFNEFGEALEEGMRRLREERQKLTDINRFYEAVVDEAPVPLLTVDGEGKVDLANKAARRLFAPHSGVHARDFACYGEAFEAILAGETPDRPRLVPLLIDDAPQNAMVSVALVHRLGGAVRTLAVQPIQGELNAVEIAAQSDLVRVLTHEIMNSMTPVTSLAHSAAQLMAEADTGTSDRIADARGAVETLARRADGVMHFVESYRQISRKPHVRRRSFAVENWARELEALFRAGDAPQGLDLEVEVMPTDLTIDADPDLLCQVLINLLRNAAEAAGANGEQPRVTLAFTGTPSGAARIEIGDNGAGVPPTLEQDIFLPFFTTKPNGTGVGLSLARQIVLAHGGSIDTARSPLGGALFRINI